MKFRKIIFTTVLLITALFAIQAEALEPNVVPIPIKKDKGIFINDQDGARWYVDTKGRRFLVNDPESAKRIAEKVPFFEILQIPLSEGGGLMKTESETDTDGDGLSDIFEEKSAYAMFLDSQKKDTDDDGYSDMEELVGGYSPKGKDKHINESVGIKNDGRLLLSISDGYLWYVKEGKKLYIGTQDRYQKIFDELIYSKSDLSVYPLGKPPENDCGIVSSMGGTLKLDSTKGGSFTPGEEIGSEAENCFKKKLAECKPASVIYSISFLLTFIDTKYEILNKKGALCKVKETVLSLATPLSTDKENIGKTTVCLYDPKKSDRFGEADYTDISCSGSRYSKEPSPKKIKQCDLEIIAPTPFVVGSEKYLIVERFKKKGEMVKWKIDDQSILTTAKKAQLSSVNDLSNGKTVYSLSISLQAKKQGKTRITVSDPLSGKQCKTRADITVYKPLPPRAREVPPDSEDCGSSGGRFSLFDDRKKTPDKCFEEYFAKCQKVYYEHIFTDEPGEEREVISQQIIGPKDGLCEIKTVRLGEKVLEVPNREERNCLYDNTQELKKAFSDKSRCKGYFSPFYYGDWQF